MFGSKFEGQDLIRTVGGMDIWCVMEVIVARQQMSISRCLIHVSLDRTFIVFTSL